MLNIAWSLLNIAILIGILYTFSQAAKLLRQYVGLGSCLLFVFGLLIIGCGRSAEKTVGKPAKNLLSSIPKDVPLGNAQSSQTVDLGGSNTLFVIAEYTKQGKVIRPRGLFATVSGLTAGHHWEPVAGMLNQRGSHLSYELSLRHEWHLLGVRVYVTSSNFSGILLK